MAFSAIIFWPCYYFAVFSPFGTFRMYWPFLAIFGHLCPFLAVLGVLGPSRPSIGVLAFFRFELSWHTFVYFALVAISAIFGRFGVF